MDNLAVVILTFDEDCHIQRAIDSARSISDKVYVIDSFSTDQTCHIASQLNAIVLQHTFKSHSSQFNWAIDQLPSDIKWIFRLDADEYLSDKLAANINSLTRNDLALHNGFSVKRTFVYNGTILKHGGSTTTTLRLFKKSYGRCENKVMDEHILVTGKIGHIHQYLYDHNLKGLSHWIDKHNKYSSLECIEYERSKNRHASQPTVSDRETIQYQFSLKDILYNRLSLRSRSILYFIYRYFILLGFLDGPNGFSFHFLQCLWYRYVVDLKIIERKSIDRQLK